MSEREQQERLIERGSWVEHFNAYRLHSSDGIIRDNVHVDLRLRESGYTYRVWLYFYSKMHPKYDEQLVAEWRRRSV